MSILKPIRKLNPKDPDLSRVERYTHEFAAQLLSNEMLSGLLLRNISLTTGQVNMVEHKLNRPVIGWVVTRKNANTSVWEDAAVNPIPSRTLNLICSADITIDLWVF